jgi:PAS domain S-box-containing protein
VIGFAKVTHDLTARRAAEESARRLAAEMAAAAQAQRAEAEARLLAEQLEEVAAVAEEARDAAQTSQSRYRQLFEASPQPTWTIDLATLGFLEVNDAAVRRYGYTRDEFARLTARDLRAPEEVAALEALIAAGGLSAGFRTATQHRTKAGERFDVEVSGREVEIDGRAALLVVAADITERTRAEAQQRFLATASELLSSSLDYDATLQRIVSLAVPTLADWAAYNVREGDRVRTVAIHHPDPALEALALELDRRYPMRADAAVGVAKALDTGASELIADVPETMLRAVAGDDEHYAMLARIGFRSLITVPVIARGQVLGALSFATGASERRFTPADLAFVEELARRAGLALGNALHFAAEHAARERAEQTAARMGRLQAAAASLSGALTAEAVADVVIREGIAGVGADAAYVLRLSTDGETLAMVRAEGYPPGVAEAYAALPISTPVPSADAVRRGVPVWLETPEARAGRYERVPGPPSALTFGASAALPLLAGGHAIGAIGFHFVEPRPFTREDRAFMHALADQYALAFERARLYDAERRARSLAERLQAVTAALSEAATPAQVTNTVVRQGLAALGAGAGFIALVDESGAALETVQAVGYPAEALAPFSRIPLALQLPVTDAVREGEPVWLESPADADARYPSLAMSRLDNRFHAWAVLPLTLGGAVRGAVGLSFGDPRRFDAEERAFMLALARQCAQALDRARLFEAEQRARRAAAAQQARAEFLSAATHTLASSLDYEATLESVARTVVPGLADWCAVDMLDDPTAATWPPSVRRLAVAHQDPAKVAWAHELHARQPPDWSAPTGLPRVLREGVTEFHPVITDEMLVAAAKSPEELALLREINFHAYLCVPLTSRGRTVGAITLVMADSGRYYDAGDRALAEELARRASLAIEHAELFREAQEGNKAKTQFLAVMSHELRTPLNAIGGYAELLELELRGPVTEAQRADLARIRRSQQHLLVLINDVLNFARIEAGQVRYELVDVQVAEVLEGVTTMIGPQAAAKSLDVDVGGCDAGVWVHADPEKLEQVLLNLLTNAVKFTPTGGRIAVTCLERGQVVEIGVSDTGIGIPEDRLTAIFEPFVQVQTGLTRTAAGTGLGLAISRDLARGMRGDLRVESVLGAGSTFTLELPVATARVATARVAPPRARP